MGKFKRPKKMCLNIGLLCFLKTKQNISNIEIFSKIENEKKTYYNKWSTNPRLPNFYLQPW